MEENAAYDKYINIKMVLDSTYEEVHARAAYWKPSVAVRALTEEWVRQSESKHLLGDEKGGHSGGSILVPGTPGEHAARVIIYLNKDLTPREAYIEGYGGKELGHQLLLQAQANHQSGVDVWHLKVPHTVTIVGDSGWVGTKVDFDENGKSHAQYTDLEREDMVKIEHLVRNGLPLFTKIDGDA